MKYKKFKIFILIVIILVVLSAIFYAFISIRNNVDPSFDVIITPKETFSSSGGYASSYNSYYVYFDKKKIKKYHFYHIYGVTDESQKNKTTTTLKSKYSITDSDIEELKTLLEKIENNPSAYTKSETISPGIHIYDFYYTIVYRNNHYDILDNETIKILNDIVLH